MKFQQYKILYVLLIITLPVEAVPQATLQNIRYGLHSDYSRIVFDLTKPVQYQIIDQNEQRIINLKLFNCLPGNYAEGLIKTENDHILSSIYLNKLSGNNFEFIINLIPQYSYRIYNLRALQQVHIFFS